MCANLLDEEGEDSEEAETADEEHGGGCSSVKSCSAVRMPSQSPSKLSKDLKPATPMRCLPNADALLSILGKGIDHAEPFASFNAAQLLEEHPAYAQLLAKHPDLRRIIEQGAEAILEPTATSICAATKVLWQVCGCVWEAIGAVVGGLCARLPSEASPLDAQMRHLMEANDDLRTRLALCRRDYLRELTELRERCRQLEPPVAEALSALLREEPVMFFEPLDFMCDETTKEFIRLTVEEKLRLLMLKGWRKGDDDEVLELKRRIQELEDENAALRSRRMVHHVYSENLAPLGIDEHIDDTGDGLHGRRLLSRPFVDVQDAEIALLAETKKSHGRDVEDEATQTLADARDDIGDLGRPCSRKSTRASTAKLITDGRSILASTSPIAGSDTHGLSQHADLAGDGASVPEIESAHRQLERKHRLLERKFARFVEQINGKVDQEVIDTTLAAVGLDRPKPPAVSRPRAAGGAFDRLYADALRRIQLLRERTAEVQALQVAELRHCSDVASDRGGKKKVEHLKGLHSKTVVCANALHDALENFHMGVARGTLEEDGDDDNEGVDSSKKEGRRMLKHQETHSDGQKQLNEEPHLIKTGLELLENRTGTDTYEITSPRARHALSEPVRGEYCRSQGNSPPQALQNESGGRAKSNGGRVTDGPYSKWRSAFGESPPKRKSAAEQADVAGGSATLPREIQALAQRLRQEQRPKTKAFGGETSSLGGCGRLRDTSRFSPGVNKATRSLPSLQRFGASRLPGSSPWPLGTGRSPRSPALQRPSSTPCSTVASWL